MPRRGTVYWTILGWLDEQISRERLRSDYGGVEELLWLKEKVLRALRPQSATNRSFFLALANQREAEGLLKWFLILIGDPDERGKVKRAARRVYGAGQPPFQPPLLAVLDEFE